MRRCLLVCLLLLCSAPAWASRPTEASVISVLEASGIEKSMNEMFVLIERHMQRRLEAEAKTMTPRQHRSAEAAAAAVIANFREEFAWKSLREVYVQVYLETFTQEEIDGMLAFYRSPAGRALVEKQPQAMQRSMQLMQPRLEAMQSRLEAELKRRMDEAAMDEATQDQAAQD